MVSKIKSATLLGLEAVDVTVEVSAQKGLPREYIVGLPSQVIKESRNRIQSAIKTSGFSYPLKTYTINLAPAEVPKEGPFLDLSIAIAMLDCTGTVDADPEAYFLGELSLDGAVKPIRGILSLVELVSRSEAKRVFLPFDNYPLAKFIPGVNFIPVKTLQETVDILSGEAAPDFPTETLSPMEAPPPPDFQEVKGQLKAKRVLEIAAAGNHNILLIGSPGSGKTMLLKRLPHILPPLSTSEVIETLKIQHLTTQEAADFTLERPFRKPHHSISYAGLVGGGSNPKPGEISLAHLGVLFLDELAEFPRQVVEVLRQPLEDHEVTISRASMTVKYPAKFMLVAAMNPCPCGYHNDPVKDCQCQESQVLKYWKKISGPILDRIDLIIHVPRLEKEDYFRENDQEKNPFTTEKMRDRITAVRALCKDRQHSTNSDLSKRNMADLCRIDGACKQILGKAVDKGILSGRSYDKVLKVARTIADLNGDHNIAVSHISEALQYRQQLK